MDTLFWEEILTKFAQKWVCINHQIRKLDSLVTQKTHFLCELKTCQNSYFCKVLLCDRGPRHIISDECPCTIKSNSRRFPENLLPWRSENLPKLFKVLWYQLRWFKKRPWKVGFFKEQASGNPLYVLNINPPGHVSKVKQICSYVERGRLISSAICNYWHFWLN